MNVPRPADNLVLGIDLGGIDAEGLALQLGADVVVAGVYLLLLVTIVYLNRQKHVALYLPRTTAWIAFGMVLVLAALASLSALALPAEKVLLGYKMFVAGLLLSVVLGVLRVLPRDIDPVERARLARENIALKEAERARRAAEDALAEAEAALESRVVERTRELVAEKTALERDIIERRLVEERAVEARRRLEELILRTGTGLAVLDGDGKVSETNLALAQFLGRGSEDEVTGRDLGRLLGLRDDTEFRHFVRETQRQGTFSVKLDASPPDRGTVAFELSGVNTVVEGRGAVMIMMWDDTERRAAERQLLQSREALSAALEVTRKANAARTDFLAKMNHELRTPLNGIIGLAEILRHKASGRTVSGVEARKMALNIHQSGRHLLSVVDDLLDLSRVDAGTRELVPVSVSMRAEIDAALATLATIAQKKRIKVENRCSEDLDWVVDQRALKQVLINLVNNAVKFSPQGKQVVVEVTHSAEALSLHVCDQGPGIAEEDRERILEPFGRGEYARSNRVDGVGLGLAIVSELMKFQGGRIEITSEPGDGATFTAVFPAGASTSEEAPLAGD